MADDNFNTINYGQAEIGAFLNQVSNGEVRFDKNEALGVVAELQTLIEGVGASREEMANGESIDGFGTLPSGVELVAGFRNKATLGRDAFRQYIEAIMQVQEGVLRAANAISEADAINARRLKLSAEALPEAS
ncbi:hypothetical protein [Nocardia sp. NPDC050413]|uniref:hypothetical protein n=1 Tax=Nocardia sp. NPDC050413 TaxID=3155784 RepID=UPI0033F02CCA